METCRGRDGDVTGRDGDVTGDGDVQLRIFVGGARLQQHGALLPRRRRPHRCPGADRRPPRVPCRASPSPLDALIHAHVPPTVPSHGILPAPQPAMPSCPHLIGARASRGPRPYSFGPTRQAVRCRLPCLRAPAVPAGLNQLQRLRQPRYAALRPARPWPCARAGRICALDIGDSDSADGVFCR